MSDEPHMRCEGCGEKVDPTDEDVLRAFQMQEIRTFGGTEMIEGMPVAFHLSCFPDGSPHYKLAPK
jgi:hypothetical protein